MSPLGGHNKKSRKLRLAACLLCLLLGSAAYAGWRFHQATDTTRVEPVELTGDTALRSGDIILAGGVSLQSRLVRSMTDDNTFSHVGLIDVGDEGVFVIHAAPAGDGDGGVGDIVGRIPLSTFLSERGYVTVQVLRLSDDNPDCARIARDARAYCARRADERVPFDADFDLNEQERLYCSELIYLAYRDAGHDWPDSMLTDVTTPLVDGPVILPGSFADAPGFETVWQTQTQEGNAP